jgi:hypothetical protein
MLLKQDLWQLGPMSVIAVRTKKNCKSHLERVVVKHWIKWLPVSNVPFCLGIP